MEISDLDKIRVIIPLQKFFIIKQKYDFCAYLRVIGREIDKKIYDQHFQKSQELDWNIDRIYHVDNFDLKSYDYAIYLIKSYCDKLPFDMVKNFQELEDLLNSNKGMWRNIKIDKILE